MAVDILESMAESADPEIKEFCRRASTENAVDLYAEYNNRATIAMMQYGTSSHEWKTLELIVKQCEMLIVSRALIERGWDSHLVAHYTRKVKR